MAITLRCELHPSGQLMQHVGTLDGIRVVAHQNEQAHNARHGGSWFLTIGVTGYPLRCYSRHRTLSDARDYADRVIAAVGGTNPTHAQLVAAVARVESPDRPVVDLDAGAEGQDVAAAGPIVVIPCGALKLATPAPACRLYRSQHFALTYRAARRLAEDQGARVFILSALHGLVDPSTVLAPYDVTMGDPDSIAPAAIAEQLAAIRPTAITSLLPRRYRDALEAAGVKVVNLYEKAPGIGYQRQVAAQICSA